LHHCLYLIIDFGFDGFIAQFFLEELMGVEVERISLVFIGQSIETIEMKRSPEFALSKNFPNLTGFFLFDFQIVFFVLLVMF